MPKIQLPIANGFYASESLPISAQRCINWYPNIVQTQGLSQETLIGTPGIRQLVTTGVINEQNRGIHVMSGICYFVNGESLYRLDRTIDANGNDVFAYTTLGAILGTGPVSMADNGTQLMILVPGGAGSIWVEGTSTFTADIDAVDSDFTVNGNPSWLYSLIAILYAIRIPRNLLNRMLIMDSIGMHWILAQQRLTLI